MRSSPRVAARSASTADLSERAAPFAMHEDSEHGGLRSRSMSQTAAGPRGAPLRWIGYTGIVEGRIGLIEPGKPSRRKMKHALTAPVGEPRRTVCRSSGPSSSRVAPADCWHERNEERAC
jgi:hypothetical protein